MDPLTVYNTEGAHVGTKELPKELFGVLVRPTLVQQAIVAQQANARSPLAHTKRREEVRGGGRKPWRQKGTGRARHGSIRSPLWKGGGVTFGPRNVRNFTVRMNVKARRAALRMALSDKAAGKRIILLDGFKLAKPKTKEFLSVLQKLPFPKSTRTPSVLTVLPTSPVEIIRATRNLPRAGVIRADSLNVVDVVKHEFLLLSVDALPVLNRMYAAVPR